MRKRLWIALAWLALLVMVASPLLAAYYIDPVSGSSENNGTTEETPKQHWSELPSLSTSDDVYLKAGTTCTDNSYTWSVSGTALDGCVIGRYGTGADPIWALPDGQNQAIYTSARSYITVQNIKFTGGTATLTESPFTAYKMLFFANGHDITVSSCTFDTVIAQSSVLFFHNASSNMYNLYVNDCTFNSVEEGVRFYPGIGTYPMLDFGIQRCTATSVKYLGRIYGTITTIGANDNSPYGFVFSDNIVTDCTGPAVAISPGLKEVVDHVNYIQRNTLTNIGTISTPNVNAIQLNWVRGTYVQDNVIDTVHTSEPDGDGIILDWAWTDDGYISSNNVVRRNTVSGCKDGDVSAAIAVYKGSNNLIYSNFVYDSGCGLKVSNANSTGNVFYNNTSTLNKRGFRVEAAGAEATVVNNILSFNSITGVSVANAGSVNPIMSYNNVHGNTVYGAYNYNTSSEIPLGTGSFTTNPLLSSSYRIAPDSPCRDTGATTSAISDITNWPRTGLFDVGAWEYRGGTIGTVTKSGVSTK